MRWSILLLTALAAAGCAGTLQDRIEHDGLAVTRGMTINDAITVLGKPEVDYHGANRLRYFSRFWKFRLFMRADTEWVWLRRDPVVVVWTRGDVITSMGTLPRASAIETRLPSGEPCRSGELPSGDDGLNALLVGVGQLVTRQRGP